MNNKRTSHKAVRSLCEGAIMIALAEILGFLPLYKMPWGGSVDLAMLPIFVFCVRWGFGPGMIVSFAHGILQMLFDGGVAYGWQSILGDYLIAYAVLGVAGLFCKMKGGFYWGVLAGCVVRFLVHYVVGATVWAEYMPETFFNMTMTSPWIYSFLYNIVYMAIDCIIILVIGFLLNKTPAKKYLAPFEKV
ncbi:MAG: energy-coupled thiamine transporter ThiT [Candidatus Avoscillospira sp.]